MKRYYISDLREGAKIEDVFLLSYQSVGSTRAGQPFLKMKLSDRTGTIDAVKWNATQEEVSTAGTLEFIQARGTVGMYNGEIQLSVDSFRKFTDKIDRSDFLATTARDIGEMWSEFNSILGQIRNPQLARLIAHFFEDERTASAFREAPAATKVHHACIGGLLEHTLNVVKSCDALAGLYPDADKEVLLVAAALHDIGKIDEYDWTVKLQFTDAGHLVGHIVGGAMMVKCAAERIDGFDPLLNLALQHAILSHHGLKEYGSPKQPKSLEAMIVNAADQLDANAAMYHNAITESQREGSLGLFTKRHFFLERPLFKGIPKAGDLPTAPELSFDVDALAAETEYDPFEED